jgi:membrane-associated progesterone receptor component
MKVKLPIGEEQFELPDDFEIKQDKLGFRDLFKLLLFKNNYTTEDLVAMVSSNNVSKMILVAVIVVLISIIIQTIYSNYEDERRRKLKLEEEAKKPPMRDFTLEQLRKFNGGTEEDKVPIYISLDMNVYDVSHSEFYVRESSYYCFVGREASVAMAKSSFDESDLSSINMNDLSGLERMNLQGWIDKFDSKYEKVGKVSFPPVNLTLTKDELIIYNGTQEVPKDRVNAPIYMAIDGIIIDVSYGGVDFYGPGGPYAKLAGKDSSRALATMQLDVDTTDCSDLTEKQLQTLQDWKMKLSAKYPIVGKLV